MEKSLIILKPDAVERALVGEILTRFERAGLRFERLELLTPSRDLVAQHYPDDDEWLSSVGQKTLDAYEERGIDVNRELGTNSPAEIGKMVKSWLVDFLSSGPVVAVVVVGNRAIESVRKLIGATLPVAAAPGSIRGDFSTDSPEFANAEGRPIKNLIHASGDAVEAAREIALWFGEEEAEFTRTPGRNERW